MSATAAAGKTIRSTISRPSRSPQLVGAGIMMLGGVIGLVFGINAEGKSLEDIRKLLTATVEPPQEAPAAPSPA